MPGISYLKEDPVYAATLNPAAQAPGGGGGVADLVAAYATSPADLADLLAMLYDEPQPRRARHAGKDSDRRPGPNPDRVRRAVDPGTADTRQKPKCGSNKAYHQHLYWGETVDDKCRAAHNLYEQQRSAAKNGRRVKNVEPYICGTLRAYRHHLAIGEPTCDKCRRYNAERVARSQ